MLDALCRRFLLMILTIDETLIKVYIAALELDARMAEEARCVAMDPRVSTERFRLPSEAISHAEVQGIYSPDPPVPVSAAPAARARDEMFDDLDEDDEDDEMEVCD